MSKIFRFEQYLEERDYFSPAGEALMEEMGEAVESFEGRYITAEDSGTSEEDMV